MKKMLALILSVMFLLSLSFTLPVSAETVDVNLSETGATMEVSALSAKMSGSNGGSNATSQIMTSGSNVEFTLNVVTSGTYRLSAVQTSFVSASEYKLFVNDVPFGVKSVGNTKNDKQTTTAELGTIELFDGNNYIKLQAMTTSSIWLNKLVVERVGDIAGNEMTVHIGNSNRRSKSGTYDTHMTKDTGIKFTVDVPAEASYAAYFVSAAYASSKNVVKMHHSTDLSTNSDGTLIVKDVQIPGHGEWGAFDLSYIGDVNFAAGTNTVIFYAQQTTSIRPRAVLLKKIEKAAEITASYKSGSMGSYNDLGGGAQALFTTTAPAAGSYTIYADVATNEGSTQRVDIFTYIGGAFQNYDQTYITSPKWTEFATNVSLGSIDLSEGVNNFYVKAGLGMIRVKNIRLVQNPPVYDTTCVSVAVNPSNGIDKDQCGQYAVTVPEAGIYKVIANVATNEASEQDFMVFAGALVGGFINYDTTTASSSSWTSFANNVDLGTIDFLAGDNTFYIQSMTGAVRIQKVRVTKVDESVQSTKLYYGQVAAGKEATTLRPGKVYAVSTLGNVKKGVTLLAALYQNGELKSVKKATQEMNLLTAEFDLTDENDKTYAIRLFVWDALEGLYPLQEASVY